MMKGLEKGRLQDAARALCVGRAALAYARGRESFGKPIWQHQPDFRDAPLMIVGEGANETQRNVVVGQLAGRGGPDA
ncbi:hypothetical protein BIV25_10015 [Streptomyces sp. MUSC 14]|nr:hypothetical protein BIV25_10015 [Streptomyces sp. MUSC 14]